MSRNVTIMSCNGYKYVRVCESYRNAEGKRTPPKHRLLHA